MYTMDRADWIIIPPNNYKGIITNENINGLALENGAGVC